MADQFVPVDGSRTFTPKYLSATEAAVEIGKIQGAWARIEGNRVRYGASPLIFSADGGWLPNDNEANMIDVVDVWIKTNDTGE